VELADVIVLNKPGLVSEAEPRRLAGLIATFSPRAEIVGSTRGQVPLSHVLRTGRFDFAQARQAAGWVQALSGHQLPESDEFGIRSFVWRALRPLHPARFKRLIDGDLPGVVRAKGLFWLATRLPWAGEWQLAGPVGRHEAAGFWWAAQPRSRWPDDPDWRAMVASQWQEPWGDRRQEIVFIGMGMDKAALRRDLEACLLTDAEMAKGAKAWSKLPDPFPAWREG
jgi:G3E family GTPase